MGTGCFANNFLKAFSRFFVIQKNLSLVFVMVVNF